MLMCHPILSTTQRTIVSCTQLLIISVKYRGWYINPQNIVLSVKVLLLETDYWIFLRKDRRLSDYIGTNPSISIFSVSASNYNYFNRTKRNTHKRAICSYTIERTPFVFKHNRVLRVRAISLSRSLVNAENNEGE